MSDRFDIEGKRITCTTVGESGQVFAEAVLVSRRGGGELEKIAGRRHPQVDAFLRSLKSDPMLQYVLMTPMGSSEFWGRNINGDYFPTLSLAYNAETDDRAATIKAITEQYLSPFGLALPQLPIRPVFGHKSFLTALRYRHHVNKDPSIAYGDIVLSVWNPFMKRVEVISRHWRDKAAEVGADDIIKDLDEGKPRQISMGCKVPFDVCTICGNISRTTTDYCDCLKNHMGEIYPDGRVAAALNLFPWFFDLSDVTTPAARESGVLEKVAQARLTHTTGPKEKTAVMVRRADIVKRVVPNVGPGPRAAVAVSAREADLPTSLLGAGSLPGMLSSLAAAGIVLKPIEFQFSVLVRAQGYAPAAHQLMAERRCFTPDATGGPIMRLGLSDVQPQILRSITPQVLQARSGLDSFLQPRVVSLLQKTASAARPVTYVENDGVLANLPALYAGYRLGLQKVGELVRAARERHPECYEHVRYQEIDEEFAKSAGARDPEALSECSLSVYVVNAYRVDPVPFNG